MQLSRGECDLRAPLPSEREQLACQLAGSGGRKGLDWARGEAHQSRDPPSGGAVLPAPLPLDAVELASAHCVPLGLASCGDAPTVNEEDPRVCLPVGEERNKLRQLPTVHPSARASMKNAANCDTQCELQNSVNH